MGPEHLSACLNRVGDSHAESMDVRVMGRKAEMEGAGVAPRKGVGTGRRKQRRLSRFGGPKLISAREGGQAKREEGLKEACGLGNA